MPIIAIGCISEALTAIRVQKLNCQAFGLSCLNDFLSFSLVCVCLDISQCDEKIDTVTDLSCSSSSE